MGDKNKSNERIGEIGFNNDGNKMTIIDYINNKNIMVKFEDGYSTKSAYSEFKNGKIRHPYYIKSKRKGEVNYNKYGSKIEIIEYIDSHNVKIQFENGYMVSNTYENFRKGNIKNPYDKSVYGIGYYGEGEYVANVNNKPTRQYDTWKSMLMRCYDERFHNKEPAYKGCSVCEEWHNYQNFAQWYDKNYYEVYDEKMELDKDILHKGNKIYNPENCVFVPEYINTLFLKCDAVRGEYPVGVTLHKQSGKYRARCNNGKGERKHLGLFYTPEQAFYAYKPFKESLIKEVANTYKNKYPQFPEKLYNAMMNYIVEITD